ncbi:hypothetical protein ACI6Q2_11780 [Chitinophagaceae bacterium LWZ2-11]
MSYIKKILEKDQPSIEELITCLEDVKEHGNIAVIKFDGERMQCQYTVFISFPFTKKREMIRADEDNLKTALFNVLNDYIR